MFAFSHGGNRNQQKGVGGGCHFDVDSGSFMCDMSTLMWLSGTLMLAFNTRRFEGEGCPTLKAVLLHSFQLFPSTLPLA